MICLQCKKDFSSKPCAEKFCSKSCWMKYRFIHGMAKAPRPMKGHNFDHGKGDVCKKCGKIHRAGTGRPRKHLSHLCLFCGKPTFNTKYCSNQCKGIDLWLKRKKMLNVVTFLRQEVPMTGELLFDRNKRPMLIWENYWSKLMKPEDLETSYERQIENLIREDVFELDMVSEEIPKREQLPKMGWQIKAVRKCLSCGGHKFTVWRENPHCFECNGELVLGVENNFYSVSEFCCSKCGVVDVGFHYIFQCDKCESEYRVMIDYQGKVVWKVHRNANA